MKSVKSKQTKVSTRKQTKTRSPKQAKASTIKRNESRTLKIILAAVLVLELIGLSALIVFIHRHAYPASVSPKIAGDEPLKPKLSPMLPPAPTQKVSTHDYTIPPITDGLAPILSRIPTSENVVFLGIDDGAYKQPFEIQLMRQNHVKASLFLANRFINDNPSFFLGFIPEGSQIEDHTIDHKLLSQLSYSEQKQEICGMADLEKQEFGRRPVLFRPPGGDYNLDTQRAAADCGMKAVVLWIAKANGGSMQYQIGHTLRPGDIVLMHFRPEFRPDFQAFIMAEKSAGLHTELLEDWL